MRKPAAVKSKKTLNPLMRMKIVIQKMPQYESHGWSALLYTSFFRSNPCALNPRSIRARDHELMHQKDYKDQDTHRRTHR